mmetsp:Transcript_10681/g.21029  ORF Transcript_10681/g.21029 Transcript_10681/m.21029 type:complete len:351 (+) Transcript_10681:919-1971(+)|eukprot:CAMPEP_0171492600 /NCGR_PEP_ID=MMETSP0958-20121227/4499_1 /TAXON_ID=87120 /ORGANISM="Aurantiochytrium limacinum, Strain ATCCMYA-1381" /LENGTH=350 /DNA_ID=CAMNT_0012026135 /DNA_START=1307 /DNA_END=2359 /DNA_ORIENTATION=+
METRKEPLGSQSISSDDVAWQTVWRLCSLNGAQSEKPLGSPQGHVSLTRFNLTRHRTICNLQPGYYKLYIFVYTGGYNDEEERNAMSPSQDTSPGSERSPRSGSVDYSKSKHASGLRSVIKTATFGRIGKLEVRADWDLVSFPDSQNSMEAQGMPVRHLQHVSKIVSVEDVPVREITFTIRPEDAPCQALFRLASTSTMTSLNVAAQLYRREDDASIHGDMDSIASDDELACTSPKNINGNGKTPNENNNKSTEETIAAKRNSVSAASGKEALIPTADRVDLLETVLLEGSDRSRGLLLTAAFLGFALGISSLSSVYLMFMFLVIACTAQSGGGVLIATPWAAAEGKKNL